MYVQFGHLLYREYMNGAHVSATNYSSLKALSIVSRVFSAISYTSSSVVVYAGANKTWSPRIPSFVPIPGYRLMPRSLRPTRCTLLATSAERGNGSLLDLSCTNSILNHRPVSTYSNPGILVGIMTHPPKQALASDVAHVWVVVEIFVQELLE